MAEEPATTPAITPGRWWNSWGWIQNLPWPVHRRAHSGYWLLLGVAVVLGLMVWSGQESLSAARRLFLIYVAVDLLFYFATLAWYAVRNRRRYRS
jgi:hypothetical protein